jgi:hypothetical protein
MCRRSDFRESWTGSAVKRHYSRLTGSVEASSCVSHDFPERLHRAATCRRRRLLAHIGPYAPLQARDGIPGLRTRCGRFSHRPELRVYVAPRGNVYLNSIPLRGRIRPLHRKVARRSRSAS